MYTAGGGEVWYDDLLGVSLAQDDEPGEVKLGVGMDCFAYLPASVVSAGRRIGFTWVVRVAASTRKCRIFAGSILATALAEWLEIRAWARPELVMSSLAS